jgi:hypothetical protein
VIDWRELMLPQLFDPHSYFADLPDPRREARNQFHHLQDISMIVRWGGSIRWRFGGVRKTYGGLDGGWFF